MRRSSPLLCAAALATLLAVAPAAAPARTPAPPRAVAPRGPLMADELNNIAVFRAASPSVVNITALGLERDLFSRNVQQVPQGTGTGFVWDTAGHLVTNYHVIQDAAGARVTLSDQSSYKAELVGAFPDRDLAVLKIVAPAGKLKPLPVGSSRDLQVGQQVYAIGNPFGLDQTLTTGIVSALNREIESVTRRVIRGAIQTDAAINPGNSGGPLLDSAGRLIGVNTAIFSPSGASAGIGFAIPVDEVNRIVPRLIRDGRMVRPALGVTGGGAEINRALGLPKGVPLVRIQRGGPAAKAGLKAFARGDGGVVQGDVITAINDEAVEDADDMLNALEKLNPGDSATLTLWRAGATRKVSVTLSESED
ncbi:MAG: trypsin-like peptidase domain-containing protein [Piscinibacter sp.]|uniref:S1C family serine protease n=1 Tax=Piscinibacter sp. TaxID=1903157 RepID=UPI001B776211|nr:trypsin-like peptidase domain-containing protein [Piscinibacter sp.]MBP5989788.1 trypsin-like peptidase domain-containing protein [Piscinibacter sp.]MBP6027057.1 trypsin-like peptidase domain-containing protein [Piscinibacter sp.]